MAYNAGLETLGEGDPRTYAPSLFAKMSGLEQRQIVNYYERRLAYVSRGFYPSDEQPATVARRAFVQGTFVVFFFVRALPFLLGGAAAISFIDYGDRNPVSVGAAVVCVLAVLALMAMWALRVAQIRRYFATKR